MWIDDVVARGLLPLYSLLSTYFTRSTTGRVESNGGGLVPLAG